MKPNRAMPGFNFAADSSGALKCFFCLLCSPYRLNNEMLTMHRQICLKIARQIGDKIIQKLKKLYFLGPNYTTKYS